MTSASALRPERTSTGLLITLLALGSVFVCRAIGVAIDGEMNDFLRAGLIFEAIITAAAAALYRGSLGGAPAAAAS